MTEQPVNFTFKITNLKKKEYSVPLTKTDVMNLEVGHYIMKGNNKNIWQIIELKRNTVSLNQLNSWRNKLNSKPSNTERKRISDYIDKYEKSLCFGACFFKVKPVIVNGVLLTPTSSYRTAWVCELPNSAFLATVNCYSRIELANVLYTSPLHSSAIINRIDELKKALNLETEFKNSLTQLICTEPQVTTITLEAPAEVAKTMESYQLIPIFDVNTNSYSYINAVKLI